MPSSVAPRPTPDQAAWDQLRSAVGGRLVKPVSPIAVSQDSSLQGNVDAEMAAHANPFANQDDPGAVEMNGYLNGWSPQVSEYAVAAESTQDVVAGVNFAREHDVRLVVKGTGHDFLGRSNAADSFLIWTHPMRDVDLEEAFIPSGAPADSEPLHVMHCGPGVRWIKAYQAATEAGRYVQGGSATSVGLGGFILGGGFGIFSKRFGCAAANLCEVEVVTADGQVLIANEHQNADLFWALRGGGGGTFGIVTRFTLRTFDIPKTVGMTISVVTAESPAAFRRLVARYLTVIAEQSADPDLSVTAHFGPGPVLAFGVMCLDRDEAGRVELSSSLVEWINGQDDLEYAELLGLDTDFQNFWDPAFYAAIDPTFVTINPDNPKQWWYGDADARVNYYVASMQSRWLPASMFAAHSIEPTADLICDASTTARVDLVTYKGLGYAAPDANGRNQKTSVHPAALESPMLALIVGDVDGLPGAVGHEPDYAQAQILADGSARAIGLLRKATPDSGAYFNESGYDEPNPQTSFWGSNYPRLLEIKKAYDPSNLFTVHLGVGSSEL